MSDVWPICSWRPLLMVTLQSSKTTYYCPFLALLLEILLIWSIFYFLQFQITSFVISHKHKEQTAPPIIHVVCKWKQNMPTHLSLFSLGKLLQYIHSEIIFFDGIYKTELLVEYSNNIACLPLKKIHIQINSLYISPTVALWIISYSFGINYRCRICWAHCNPLIFIMREGSNHGVSSSMLCFLLTI